MNKVISLITISMLTGTPGSFILQRCRQKYPTECLKRYFGYKNDARKSFKSIIGDLRLPLFCYIFRIWVEIWAEKNFKKKTFFSRHVQKWNNNFEIFFLWKFSIFLKNIFRKMVITFFWNRLFSWNFFSTV